jgi:hypothetical protein
LGWAVVTAPATANSAASEVCRVHDNRFMIWVSSA